MSGKVEQADTRASVAAITIFFMMFPSWWGYEARQLVRAAWRERFKPLARCYARNQIASCAACQRCTRSCHKLSAGLSSTSAQNPAVTPAARRSAMPMAPLLSALPPRWPNCARRSESSSRRWKRSTKTAFVAKSTRNFLRSERLGNHAIRVGKSGARTEPIRCSRPRRHSSFLN